MEMKEEFSYDKDHIEQAPLIYQTVSQLVLNLFHRDCVQIKEKSQNMWLDL